MSAWLGVESGALTRIASVDFTPMSVIKIHQLSELPVVVFGMNWWDN